MSYAPPKIASKHFPEYVKALKSQKGRNVAITGTTSGIGLIAAQTAYAKGANVYLLNRNSSRVEPAIEKLKTRAKEMENFEEGKLEFIECDLQSFESVKKAAATLNQKVGTEGLHVLANNAGIMAWADEATKDGYDVQMQVNHLSHFLLTKELYPSLQKAAENSEPGSIRIVNQSSGARNHAGQHLQEKYLGKNGGNLGGNGNSMIFMGGRWRRYQQTKLANSVFTKALAERLEKGNSKVVSVCAHPGLSATDLQLNTTKNNGLGNLFTKVLMKFSHSAEDGSLGLIMGMFGDVENGKLYGPAGLTGMAESVPHGKFCTDESAELLWKKSEEACGEFKI